MLAMDEFGWFAIIVVVLVTVIGIVAGVDRYFEYQQSMRALESGYEQVWDDVGRRPLWKKVANQS